MRPTSTPFWDHFIPWARYPDNGLENLVVAHERCKRAKRDFLAAPMHVTKWRARNSAEARVLAQIPEGRPVVPNGVALCKLHHAASDANILGIRPDYRIEIRLDVLTESDGPMLKHGLQEFHNGLLLAPARTVHRPKPEFLEERYALFKRAS